MEINRELLTQTAEWFEAHPERYEFGWGRCIAGRLVRLAGGRFVVGEFGLRPTADDNQLDVQRYDGTRYVTVEDRARRLAGLTYEQAKQLFVMRPPQDGGAGLEAAGVIRQFLAEVGS